MPEGPAVAGRRPLHLRRDRVDRAAVLGGDQAAVGAHPRGPAPVGVAEDVPGVEKTVPDAAAARAAVPPVPLVAGLVFAQRRRLHGETPPRAQEDIGGSLATGTTNQDT